MPEWCAWKAIVQWVLGILHLLKTDGQKAGNSLINVKYTKGAACEVWVTQISSNSCQSGVHGKPLLSCEVWVTRIGSDSCWNGLQFMLEWYPWKATVEGVLGMPHLLNTDGQMAGNSLINGTYIPGTACEVWVTQISSNSCWNGVHGKPLWRGCWGYLIHSIQMGG
ncbi:hypothetical protein BKA82DRAFT_8345 [Pisolithus tinctorius]|uniref:Uncharacterized protein n=1 Tax=Pisolithus tinctorius Marx 270 TaxID=870435 RepID=A0A0C3PJ23_PISTI|nr:hypothetical protein BKA82DRAFT_8345 [Pisolithus tinctorius]KIO08129.1 hypothetical protein M404DRAFT_8345 [Pisolithus tinctorius Marx 270]